MATHTPQTRPTAPGPLRGLTRTVAAAWPRWDLVARQRSYWTTRYLQTWKGSAVTSFVMPLLYVVAMGVLLGEYVDEGGADLQGAPSYLAFVTPGLVATTAMQTAVGAATWPVLGNIKWHRTYYAMLATPLQVADVVAAHLIFIAFRVATVTAVFLLVMVPFGVFATWWGVLLAWPVLTLLGLAFGGVLFAFSASIEDESGFMLVYRVLVIPLFLFSGAFFPLSQLPALLEAVAWATPLSHGVALTRGLTLNTLEAGPAMLHLGYLLALSLLGWVLAVRRLDKRMEV
jgi:lipooligosaccharide transport system permease protein